jgi:YaiO family outer membrane protein
MFGVRYSSLRIQGPLGQGLVSALLLFHGSVSLAQGLRSEAAAQASLPIVRTRPPIPCPFGLDERFESTRHLAWSGRYGDAEKGYLALIDDCPWNSDYLMGLGDVRFWKGELDLANDAYQKALLISPERRDAIEALARILKKKADAPGIKALLERAKRHLDPLPHAEVVNYVASLDYAVDTESFTRQNLWETEVGGGYEYLNHGYRDWSSSYVGIRRSEPDRVVYGRAAELNRFGLTDAALTLGATQKFLDRWTASFETYDSPTGHFIPQWSLLGGLRYQTDWPLGIEVGFRHSSYRNISNEIGTIGVDSYLGQFRVAPTLYMSQLQGAGGLKFSGLLDVSWYFGDRSNIGIMLGYGTQPIILAPGIYRNDEVQTYLVKGLYEISGPWAIYFDGGVIVQGQSYTRSGANVGLKYQF